MLHCCQRAKLACVYLLINTMGQNKGSFGWGQIHNYLHLTLGKAGLLTFVNQVSQDSEVCAQTSMKVSSAKRKKQSA